MTDPDRQIKISITVARWMVSIGRQIVQEAYGSNWDPMRDDLSIADENIDPVPGFMDDVPLDNNPMYFWIDAMVRFVRVMSGIAANELRRLDGEELEQLNNDEI